MISFEKAILLNPQNAKYLYNKGLIQYKLENYEKAIKSYREAIRINANFPGAYFNIGLAYEKLNKMSIYIMNLNKAI